MAVHTASRRPDALNPYRNSFNAIRLLAALQVVFMHSIAYLNLPRGLLFEIASQFPGVPIFFAVSGFLVFDSYLRSTPVKYAINRAARIYPGLAVNILVIEFVFWLGGGTSFANLTTGQTATYEGFYVLTASTIFGPLLTSYAPAWLSGGFFKMYPSGVLWTLTVELSFYGFLFVAGATLRKRNIGSMVVASFVIASLFVLYQVPIDVQSPYIQILYTTCIPYFWMFAVGMLARYWVREILSLRWLLPVIAVVFAAMAMATDFASLDYKMTPDIAGMFKTLLVCALVVLIGLSPAMKSTVLVKVDASYGIYLWHMLFITTAISLGYTGWATFVVVVPASICTGVLAWLLIEKPASTLIKRKIRVIAVA